MRVILMANKKHGSVCSLTGRKFNRGECIAWEPSTGKVYDPSRVDPSSTVVDKFNRIKPVLIAQIKPALVAQEMPKPVMAAHILSDRPALLPAPKGRTVTTTVTRRDGETVVTTVYRK